MTKTEVAVRRTDSISDEIAQRHEKIRRRAYELFQSSGDGLAAEFDHWLKAERELSLPPSIQLRQADGKFEVEAALPGVDPKSVDVQATTEDVLITAERSDSAAKADASSKPADAMGSVKYFAAIHFPAPIDPTNVKANYRQGLLHLTAAIAKPQTTKVEVRV